jgi:NAD(P)-dependent dehydrogenase (short-subunit alcohol dehydrogenase family)
VAVRGDVASLSDLDALADRVKSELGTIEALFVNAGIAPLTPFESTTEEAYDELFAINVKGAYFTVQKLAPLLSTGAGVVLTTSVANVIGLRDTSVYSAGKAALRSMARSLSSELLPRGIRVNAISPGPIDTGILESMMTAEAAEQFKAERVANNPMRRFGTPDEVARAAAFLAFEATYTTGAELAVDGGATQL